jgi:PAS domain
LRLPVAVLLLTLVAITKVPCRVRLSKPFTNINPHIEAPALQAQIAEVMAQLKTTEQDVKDKSGMAYHMRILPYRTNDGKIEGTVITMLPVPPAGNDGGK